MTNSFLNIPIKNLKKDDIFNYLNENLRRYNIDDPYETIDISNKNLYRIRKSNIPFDINKICEWMIPPKKCRKMNRCNYKEEGVLYLSDNPKICIFELGLKENQKFACCQYLISNNLKIKAFYTLRNYDEDRNNCLELFCFLNILSAIMAIPSFTEIEIADIDKYQKQSLCEYLVVEHHNNGGVYLPYILKKIIDSENDIYLLTNLIVDQFKSDKYDGVLYPSCFFSNAHSYFPIDKNYNLVLFEKAANKINMNEVKEFIMNCDIKKMIINNINTSIKNMRKL